MGEYRGHKDNRKKTSAPEEVKRVRLPREGEVIGLVIGMMGGSRMRVECKDGKDRMCRIPGRLKNNIWVRDGDVVVVEPWELEGDKKGDIVWRYRPLEVKWLRDRNYI